jgi:hypothetical protein
MKSILELPTKQTKEKTMAKKKQQKLPKIGLLYLDYVLRFFDKSNFRGWPDKIEMVTYHWKNDKQRFIREVKRKDRYPDWQHPRNGL